MDVFELLRSGLPFGKAQDMMSEKQPVQQLMALGLSKKTIRGCKDGPKSCAFKGSMLYSHL